MKRFGDRPIGVVRPPLTAVEVAAPMASLYLGVASDLFGKDGVTRARADLLYGPTLTNLALLTIGPTSTGTAVLRATIDAGQGAGTSTILGQNAGLQLFQRNGDDLVAGGVASSVNLGAYNPLGEDVMAITWSDIEGQFQAALNGVALPPSAFTAGALNADLGLMARPDTSSPTAGTLNSLTFYPEKSTEQQLVILTT